MGLPFREKNHDRRSHVGTVTERRTDGWTGKFTIIKTTLYV